MWPPLAGVVYAHFSWVHNLYTLSLHHVYKQQLSLVNVWTDSPQLLTLPFTTQLRLNYGTYTTKTHTVNFGFISILLRPRWWDPEESWFWGSHWQWLDLCGSMYCGENQWRFIPGTVEWEGNRKVMHVTLGKYLSCQLLQHFLTLDILLLKVSHELHFSLLCYPSGYSIALHNQETTVSFFLPPARFWKRWEVLFWGPSPSPQMCCFISRLLLKLAFLNLACAIYAKTILLKCF